MLTTADNVGGRVRRCQYANPSRGYCVSQLPKRDAREVCSQVVANWKGPKVSMELSMSAP